MACSPKFESAIPLECVIDAVQQIRSGQISVDTAKKILWTIGCILEKVSPSTPVIGGAIAAGVPVEDSPTDAVIELLAEMRRTVETGPLMSSSPEAVELGVPPEVWMMLIELILKLLKK